MSEGAGGGTERRGAERRGAEPERRRYQRRATPVTPPYFETFERIAVALERAVALLEQRQITLPDVPPSSPAKPRSTANS